MNKKLRTSVIKTLSYAQIFSYPLTVSELWKYLIVEESKKQKSRKKISPSREEFADKLSKLSGVFERYQQYVVLPGDEKLIFERNTRAQESRRKLAKALWISQILSFIPGIQLIAISGSLSMYNAKPYDDIDLFFITKKNRLWTTRFLVNLILLCFGEKRSRKDRHAMDKICPNMFISEDALEIKKHNLYLAHEIAQIKVLVSKNNAYNNFISKNKWVLNFLPNAFSVQDHAARKTSSSKKKNEFFLTPGAVLEKILYRTQYFYMKKRITNEKVGKSIASFHPLKQGDAILSLYALKIKAHKKGVRTSYQKQALMPFRTIN